MCYKRYGVRSKAMFLLFLVALLLSPPFLSAEEVYEITESELQALETTLSEQNETLSEQRTTLEAQATTIEKLESTIETQKKTTETLRTSFDEYESEAGRQRIRAYVTGGAIGVGVGAVAALLLVR